MVANIEQRRQELDVIQQMNARFAAERAAREKVHTDFAQRVQALHNSGANLAALLAEARANIGSLNDYWQAQAEEERLAKEEAERQRIAALTPREIWMSTLPWHEQMHVQKWERINRRPYPLELPVAAIH